jgi:hypothetical protein
MSQPTATCTPLATFLAAVAQYQSARRVLFDTLAQHPHVVLQYTDTLNGRFADIDGGDLLQELHLYAKEQLSASAGPRRGKALIAH